MPYRRNNYDFVVGNSFRPIEMQEMLTPFMMYKDAYEKSEAAYDDLSMKADTFKYLADKLEDNPNSEAARIYKGYADELSKQAEDLAKNGLSINNRRALTNLKRRYQGEIGRLVNADNAMQEEKKLRRTMNTKDSSMLYATDNLSIDDFLDGNSPNLYNISGTELYTRGAAAGKSASSRVYSAGDEGSTLGGYYRKWVERNGYSKESMDAFRANIQAIPELQQAADDILTERGVSANLTGNNLERARQSVINGIIDGAIYQEKVNPVRDPGVMSASEKDASARGWAAQKIAQEKWNEEKAENQIKRDIMYRQNPETGKWELNPEYINGNYDVDPNTGKLKKKSTAQTAEEKQAAAEENKKGVALMKLDNADLGHNEGFDVTFGDNRHHYDYIGAISRHGNKWHHGAIGEDNPGHNWGIGWGFGSTSNVENKWGNFSAEGVDSPAKMRVLSADEFMRLVSSDETILQAIEERCKAAGVDPTTADIQIVEVPNERGGNGQKGYLVAVH